ncbi:hypothetical protein M422DRAFT_53309 [Sphaerobolus stellatus SS14]|uniref:Uncharacterized protein n=1 Tax=Sphaerobolus stellatus (strain SS14) TaxID=990650 RepID=A0A0C9UR52_SPHS4|nr:hypothetical protein M422DRAFT_53309 [Sphaerobolus stellatus SS14]
MSEFSKLPGNFNILDHLNMTPCRKLSASEQDFVFREQDLADPDNPMHDGLLQNDADAQDIDAQDDDDAVMDDAAALSDKDAVMKDCDEGVLNNDDNQAALSEYGAAQKDLSDSPETEDDAAQKDPSDSSKTEEAAELRTYVGYLKFYRCMSAAPDLPKWVNRGTGPDW